MKQDKYLKRALAHFGYKSDTLLTETDVKVYISDCKELVETCDNKITEYEIMKKDTSEKLDLMKDVLIQMEIELYKELNPKAEVFAVS